jgi:hypothetical protein
VRIEYVVSAFSSGIPFENPDRQTAEDVDGRDDNRGDGIAFHKFHGAVHRAIELVFLLENRSASAGFVHIDDAGAHVRIDTHLLARHGVEGEPRADFRDAPAPFVTTMN